MLLKQHLHTNPMQSEQLFVYFRHRLWVSACLRTRNKYNSDVTFKICEELVFTSVETIVNYAEL